MSPDFTGNETPSDVLKTVLTNFSQPGNAEIVYEGDIAYLKVYSDTPTEFVCIYRLDKLLLPLFADCETLCDHYISVGYIDSASRERVVRMLAYVAMWHWLNGFVIHHLHIFLESSDEARFLTESVFLQSFTSVHSKPENQDRVSRTLSLSARQALDKVMKTITKRRRDFLAGYLNKLPLLTVPVGVGRPEGSVKSSDEKRKEAAKFEAKIEETILALHAASGRIPTKTAVAEALGIGGINPKGTDSRINSFNNRLARLGIDYAAIIKRLNLHE